MNLFEMSVVAAVMILLIIIIRAIWLDKLPRLTFPILWGLVLVRLVLPLSFDSVLSINDFLLRPFNEVTIAEILESTVLVETPNYYQNITMNTDNVIENSAVNLPTMTMTQQYSSMDYLLIVWLFGVGISVTVFATNYWKSHQKIRCSLPADLPAFAGWVANCNLKRPLEIRLSDQITTPVATGVFKPKIILPTGLDSTQTDNLEYILAHELYHLKRFDPLWKMLLITTACLHWFNPLVWVMCILANRDLEISCDAWVVKNVAKNRKKTYAYTLIEFAERESSFMPFYNGFARHATHERIRSIMKRKRTTVASMLIAVLFGTFLTINAFAMVGDSGYNQIEDPVVLASDPEIKPEPVLYEPLSEEIEQYVSLEERLATFSTVTVNDMTFHVGDVSLGERTAHTARPNFEMPTNYISAESATIMLALGIYQHLGVSVDNTYFDIFLMDNRYFGGLAWTGFIVTPEYWGYPEMDIANHTMLFNFFVSAVTGELLGITHNDNGFWTIYDSSWQEYRPNID